MRFALVVTGILRCGLGAGFRQRSKRAGQVPVPMEIAVHGHCLAQEVDSFLVPTELAVSLLRAPPCLSFATTCIRPAVQDKDRRTDR